MRVSSLYLVPTLATTVVLGAACALPAASSRPVWFTTGGPLYGILDDPPPFSPVVWKRRCLGVTWLDQQPTGEWLGCAGLPFGPRLEYQSLTDTQPWTPQGNPSNLDPLIIAQQAGVSNCNRAAILSWRRTSQFEEVLLVTEGKASQWSVVRAQRFSTDARPAWEGFIGLDAPATAVVEMEKHPSGHDLAQFAHSSWWNQLETSPRIESWWVSHEAWAWATGNVNSTELDREVDRLKRYTFSERSPRDAAKAAARFAGFVLLPGRSVVLPESVSAKLRESQCSRADVPDFESTWTPSPADVAALESMLYKLNPILYRGGANTERRKPLRLNVNDYHRQYSGLQIAGRRFIYVNALHIRSVDEEWRTKILAICDGGYAAWGALYDPSAQEFLNFSVNGVA